MSETVSISLGDLLGVREAGVVKFRAVPYAAPPVGALRFAPPAPPLPWQSLRDVRQHGPIAPQPPSRLRMAMGDFEERVQSEDCLTLAIATPAVDVAKRPVLVWLHGGAFLSGAGSLNWYDGGAMAAFGDVVVVGVNYRLGPLGFLHYPGLADGKMGLHDIVAALRFVHEHIAAFGGDPNNVTVMGQSAGGNAIMRLLTMDHTAGLFHRAIIQSGPVRIAPTSAEGTARARRLMELLEIDPDQEDAIDQLRAAPVEKLVTLQMVVARELAQFARVNPAFPPVSDDFGDEAAYSDRIAAAAAARGIDVMLGTTREEMHAFFVADPAMAQPDPAGVAERFTTLAGSEAAIKLYRARRPGGDVRDLLGDLVTDHFFLAPTLGVADRIAAAGQRAFVYRFDWASPITPWKACHCIELPFLFGTLDAWHAPMLEGLNPTEYAGISTAMMGAWTRFARSGNPSSAEMPWPAYGPGHREVLRIGPLIEAVSSATVA